MKKEKPNRIYIFVPRTFKTNRGVVQMSNGRAAAQCAHATALLSFFTKKAQTLNDDISRMTIIILAAASSSHLMQIMELLGRFKIPFLLQEDTFEEGAELYPQVIIVGPITKKQSELFQFSGLW